MKFRNLVAFIAIISIGAQANAQSEWSNSEPTTQGVVIMNTNSNSNSNAAAAVAQPTTIVEASPATESRADLMRKARQSAEMQTEQKIVEKLEESRLREEQQRAERLFGNKLENETVVAPAAAATATAIATPTGAAASATAVTTTAPVVAPVVVEEIKEEKPTAIVIEKVEIVQPVKEEKEVGESKLAIEPQQEEKAKDRLYISGVLGAPWYDASNVKSNYAIGFGAGSIINENIGVEGSFVYSNHTVDTFWIDPIYKELDQYDVSASARYYFLRNRVKPYAGGSVTYIYRHYQDRVQEGSAWMVNQSDEVEESHAVNLGILLGVDFELTRNIMLGAGMDWNFNLANKNEFNSSSYGNAIANSKPLEEIQYSTLKLNLKVLF